MLNKKEPIAVGPMDLQPYLTEHKRQQTEAMKNAMKVIEDVAKDFEKMTGRKYDFFEGYQLEDAEYVVVCMNSTAGTVKNVVDTLRSKGIKAGALKVRVFRPFPGELIAKALEGKKAVAILDRVPFVSSVGGPLFEDVVSAMFTQNIHIPTINYSYGVGGRDVTEDQIESIYKDLQELKDMNNPYRFLGLRERR